MKKLIISACLVIACNTTFAQKLLPSQKSLDQITLEVRTNLSQQVHDMFKSQYHQKLKVRFLFTDRLSLNAYQQTMYEDDLNDYTPKTRYDIRFRSNINTKTKFVARGMFYGLQGISNIYTIGIIYKF